jgi:hypothetical protein
MAKAKESTYEEFRRMSSEIGKSFRREPRSEAEFTQQAFSSVFRLIRFMCWWLAILFRYAFKTCRRLLGMVFGRGKKKDERVMLPPDMYAQYAAMQQQFARQPVYPQSVYQQPWEPPQFQQPAFQQPAQQVMQPVRQPVYQGAPAGQPVPLAEQLMQSFLSLVDKFKECDVRLLKLETVVNDMFDRLNQLDGVQPAADKRIAFPKRK